MTTNNAETFVDMIRNTVAAQQAQEQQEVADLNARISAENERLGALFRPITTLLTQAKEAYPWFPVYNPAPYAYHMAGADLSYRWPHFYVSSHGYIEIRHMGREFTVRLEESGYVQTLGQFQHAEDAIPMLVTHIATRVRTRRASR